MAADQADGEQDDDGAKEQGSGRPGRKLADTRRQEALAQAAEAHGRRQHRQPGNRDLSGQVSQQTPLFRHSGNRLDLFHIGMERRAMIFLFGRHGL